jgi:NAD-dependent protein deacetylase/lipoamidase
MNQLPDQATSALDVTVATLRRARCAIVLTGAGISTPSGIPDFRSEGSGLWARQEPLEVASLSAFREHPDKFFRWFQPLAGQILAAIPNPAHLALAALEGAGHIQMIITQNIDALHQRAGSKNVVEMHGSLRTLTCTQCFQRVESEGRLPAYLETGRAPICPRCGSVLKPDVILFGEQLPQKVWLQAEAAARACDLMIVAGSSLEVLPVASLPMTAIEHGAHLVIINQTETYLNVRADATFLADVATVLPRIAELVLHG